MTKVATIKNLDLYVGKDESKNFKPWYNIVPKNSPTPAKGYYSPEFIARQFKVSPSFFFPEI